MATNYIQVNIGRNVDNVPLNDTVWQTFIDTIKAELVATAFGSALVTVEEWDALLDTVEVHIGSGTWDGITEESAKISLFYADGFRDSNIDILRSQLATHRNIYRQDSVALILGSELI